MTNQNGWQLCKSWITKKEMYVGTLRKTAQVTFISVVVFRFFILEKSINIFHSFFKIMGYEYKCRNNPIFLVLKS